MHSPSLPEIVRVDSTSLDSAVSHLLSFLDPAGGNFNYLESTKRTRKAYQGLHNLSLLTAGVPSQFTKVGFAYNIEVVRLAAPLSFGRITSVFDLPHRKLPYGAGRLASYRVPFFYVEKGVVRAYFLQPRKNTHFTIDQYSMFSSILKKHLLDTEFYGEKVDVDIVDVSRNADEKERSIKQFSLSDLTPWADSVIQEHFRIVSEALRVIENEKLVNKVRRPLKDKELPLFD